LSSKRLATIHPLQTGRMDDRRQTDDIHRPTISSTVTYRLSIRSAKKRLAEALQAVAVGLSGEQRLGSSSTSALAVPLVGYSSLRSATERSRRRCKNFEQSAIRSDVFTACVCGYPRL